MFDLFDDHWREVPTRPRTRTARAGALRLLHVGTLIGLAACSSGGDSAADPSTSVASAVTTSVRTTTDTSVAGAPSITQTTGTTTSAISRQPATTPPVASTTQDTTAPSVTSAGNTTPALDDVQSAVAAAYTAAFDSWTACLAALPNCDLSTLDPYRAGDYLVMSRTQAGLYIDAGQTTSAVDQRHLRIESVTVESSGTQASVQSCEVDAVVRYNSSGDVVNDDFESVRRISVVVLDGDSWKVTGFENLEAGSTPEENVCAA